MSTLLDAPSRPFRIALLGNPNTGKSTLFNRLTGLRQHIANYPGITVEKKTGFLEIADHQIELVDLPGAYSLAATSPDERAVMDMLGGRAGQSAPDLVVCVVDSTNIKRNLFLVCQAAELEIPMVLVLNQWDAACRQGLKIDTKLLSARLGIPVVPTVAKRGENLTELKKAICSALDDRWLPSRLKWPDFVLEARRLLTDELRRLGKPVTDPEALRILFDANGAITDQLTRRERLQPVLATARNLIWSHGMNPASAEAVLHYRRIALLLEGVIVQEGPHGSPHAGVDAILLHRFWGTIVFLGVMCLVFQSLYAWAGPMMDLIELGTLRLQEAAAPLFETMPMLQSLVTDGIIAGVGGVVIFLPQILILFLFIAVLEDSGYLARAAFLMDKLFGWCGLNGKSFVPLLSGYACAIPGIMAARTLEDPKARMTTILITPLMSCSARLPVYVLLIGAFVEPVYGPIAAGWALFAVHFIGAFVAMPLAWFMNRCILRIEAQPFILEMPGYRVPALRNVLIRMWERGKDFVIRAGTVILAFSIIIWALLYFPRPAEVAATVRSDFLAEHHLSADSSPGLTPQLSAELAHRIDSACLEQSYLGRFGKAVQPLFDPAGFDWKITVGVLSSFPAREVVIATLGIIYNLGSEVDESSDDLRAILARETWSSGPRQGQPVYTLPAVCSIMVFYALCLQCGATVAVIARELNWRWALGAFTSLTVIAWTASVLVYQIGSRFWP